MMQAHQIVCFECSWLHAFASLSQRAAIRRRRAVYSQTCTAPILISSSSSDLFGSFLIGREPRGASVSSGHNSFVAFVRNKNVHKGCDTIDALSFPAFGSTVAPVVKDEYKLPLVLGSYAVGAIGITILALDRCCRWSFGFYLSVQVAYDLFQGAVIGVLIAFEGELTDGGYFPGVAKTLVALTSLVDLFVLKGPAECLGVGGFTLPDILSPRHSEELRKQLWRRRRGCRDSGSYLRRNRAVILGGRNWTSQELGSRPDHALHTAYRGTVLTPVGGASATAATMATAVTTAAAVTTTTAVTTATTT